MEKNKLNPALLKILFAVISAITIAISFINLESNKFTMVAIASVIELIAFIVITKLITGKFMDYSVIFISILFLFHFGQLILLGIFEGISRANELRIVLDFIPTDECVWALRIMNIVFAVMCIGTLIKAKKNISKQDLPEQEKNKKSYGKYFKEAIFIIGITFPIKLVIDAIYLYISISQGFIAGRSWYSEFPDVLKTVGNFSLIGFALLLIVFREKPKKQTLLMLCIGLYFCLLMSTGRRSENVAYLCVFIFVYLKSATFKIGFKRLILYGTLGYILLAFLFTVVDMREKESLSVMAFLEDLGASLTSNNIILQALREYGNTGYTAICVLCYWLPNFAPSYGKSYYLGVSAVFPNIGGVMGEMSTESAFALKLQDYHTLNENYQNIGGSFIGELFFNFDIIGGIIAALIAGLCLGFISLKVNKHFNNGHYNKLMKYIPIMTGSIFWIRDSFQGGIREIVWGMLFCVLITAIFNSKGNKRDEQKESTYCN